MKSGAVATKREKRPTPPRAIYAAPSTTFFSRLFDRRSVAAPIWGSSLVPVDDVDDSESETEGTGSGADIDVVVVSAGSSVLSRDEADAQA